MPKNFSKSNWYVITGGPSSGKTTILKKLKKLGYIVAIPTDHGLRQDIRNIEKTTGRLIPEPARGQYFAHAMVQSVIASNAHTLRGSCFISLTDRSLLSLPMHHGLFSQEDLTIPELLNRHAPIIQPDLTFIMQIADPNLNWELLKRSPDLANQSRTKEQLAFQRNYYYNVNQNELTGNIIKLENPGTENSLDSVTQKIFQEIEL